MVLYKTETWCLVLSGFFGNGRSNGNTFSFRKYLAAILDVLKWPLLRIRLADRRDFGLYGGVFSMADLMVKLSVSENPKWRPAAI